ncbi:MAG: trehalase family glycosidase [Promethearchaeota archaeon]
MLGSLENCQTSYFLFPYHREQLDPRKCIQCVISSSIQICFQDRILCSIAIPEGRINYTWYGALLEAIDDAESIRFSIFYDGNNIFIQFTSHFNIITPDPTENEISSFYRFSKISDTQYIFTAVDSPPLGSTSEIISQFISKMDTGKKDICAITVNGDFILPVLWKDLWIPPLFNALKIDYIAEFIQNSLNSSKNSPEYISFQKGSLYHQILLMDDLLWCNPQKIGTLIPKFLQTIQKNLDLVHRSTGISPKFGEVSLYPPIWSYFILNYVKYSGDLHYLSDIYKILKEDLTWWENSRFDSKYGLFYSSGKVSTLEQETQIFLSPRFRFRKINDRFHPVDLEKNQKMILVDLNAQICDYYQNMGVFGMMLDQPEYPEYFEKAQHLQEAYELLWDPVSQFYYDFDIESEELHKIKTSAGFWALFGGIACKSYLKPLIGHLMNTEEFWTDFPISHVSLDDFANLPGPSLNYGFLAQNYWFIIGLRKYNCNDVATQIALKTLNFLSTSYETTGKIHAIYPVLSSHALDDFRDNFPGLKNTSNYYSVLPLHSIFYKGILGAEILDDSINFVPNWGILNQEISFSFQYRGQKRCGVLSKTKKKMFEICNEIIF